jgi:acetolactate synthase-1/3 small subunit
VGADLRTFIVHVEDRPGALNRVVSLFRRRSYNIESLTVGRTERPSVSRITLVVRADEGAALRLEANLYKLIDVLEVRDVTSSPAVIRELAFVKLDAASRTEILQLCEVFRARVVDVGRSSITVESTGTQDKIDGLIDALRPFGIVELVRTGAVAMTRGAPVAALVRPDGDTADTEISQNQIPSMHSFPSSEA